MFVHVLNRHGRPLMPCPPGKARRLLKQKKARVKARTPFTIQLLYGSSGYKQPVVLGVDAGSKTIGLSASTEKQELFAAEVKPRNDVVNLLSTRREFRRARRNRKTRHRMPRFNNRIKSKHKGWLAPSVEVKIQEHITVIKRVCGILPIAKVIVETAEFDTQRLKAVMEGRPQPVGTDYQLGELYDEYNVRQYVLKRDNYTCQCCGAHSDKENGIRLHVHHLESRKTGGSAPGNLITLCARCHKLLHEGKITLGRKRRIQSMRDAAFMGIMRKTLIKRLRNELDILIEETYGYITKLTREMHGMAKTHMVDALCIAGHPEAGISDANYLIKPVRRHNRRLHKATILKGGIRKANQTARYVKGFRLYDKVSYQGQECFIWGRRSSGSFLLKMLDGTKIKDSISYKKLTLLERETNYLTERRMGCFSSCLKTGGFRSINIL